MPQDVEFHVPFPHRVSRDLGRARAHNVTWLRGLGLLAPGPVTDRYVSGGLEVVAAMCHPQATGAGLDLGLDQLSFLHIFGEVVHGPLGRDPDACAEVCGRFAAAAGGTIAGPRNPLLAAFLDVWSRSRAGMSGGWCERAERDWVGYFTGHPGAAARRHGAPPTIEEYLGLCRPTTGVRPVVNLVERLSGYEIPARVRAADRLQRMIAIAEDVVTLISDVQTVEADEAAGEVLLNILFLLGRALDCSRTAAVVIVQAMVVDLVAEFQRLRESLPALADRARLTPSDRGHLGLFVEDGLCAVMHGTYIGGNAARRGPAGPRHRRRA
ncbi:MAG: terpene synthase family protein [Actinomadura sp.]